METTSTLDRVKPGSRHRRQVFWQIIFPVVLAAAGGIFLVVILSLSAIKGSNTASQWASISTIWLIIPLLVLGILFLFVLLGLIFGIAWLTKKLPVGTHLVHTYLQVINIRFGILMNRIVQPQISTLSRWAGLKALGKSLWRIGENR